MKLKVIAYTQPEKGKILSNEFSSSSLLGLSGRFANVCYMAGDMETVLSQPEEKAIKRMNDCAKNNHLSVFEHCSISVAIEEAPKIIAMLLNSFRLYSTSEKSGRYTIMHGLEERDQILYEKWIKKLTPIIKEIDPSLNESGVNKLAIENARYFISIFSPSTDMIYTTNVHQWSAIHSNLCMYYHRLQIENTSFIQNIYNDKLMGCLDELIKLIQSEILDKFKIPISDWKQTFNPMSFNDPLNLYTKHDDFKEEVGYTFSLKSEMSFVALGHKERSRVINICFSIPEEFKFFTPKFIRDNNELREEWEKDMKSIFDLIPQGMKVDVIEHGLTEDFLKYQVTERLCSRAQYETYSIVNKQAKKVVCLILQNQNVSDEFKEWVLSNFTDSNGKIRIKCQFGNCLPCGKNCRERIL